MGTPLIQTMKNDSSPVLAVELLPSSSGHGASGVGTHGSSPGVWVPPAEADSASAQVSAQDASSLFIIETPIEMVRDGGGIASAKTLHCTPIPDPDLVLFRLLADRKDFDSLDALCAQRIFTARDDRETLRWRKDRAIVFSLQDKFSEAYEVLRDAEWLAARVEGVVRGKYENEFGMVLVEHFGRPALALDRFSLGIEHVLRDGSVKVAFDIEHNIGRAYAAQGEHAKATPYFQRALAFARESNDYRLEMEICESLVEFG